MYEGIYGKLHKETVIDHLCRNKKCINPNHLEHVTHRMNILRGVGLSAQHAKKTKCPKGHKYDKVNSRGSRECSICRKESKARYRAKAKAIRSLAGEKE